MFFKQLSNITNIIFQGQDFFCYLQIRYFTKEERITITAIISEKIPFKKYLKIHFVWNIISFRCKVAIPKAFLEIPHSLLSQGMLKRTEDEVWEYARYLSVCISQRSSPSNVAYSLLTAGKYKVSENLLCEPLRMLLGMSKSNSNVKMSFAELKSGEGLVKACKLGAGGRGFVCVGFSTCP